MLSTPLPLLIQKLNASKAMVDRGLRLNDNALIQNGIDQFACLCGRTLTELSASEDSGMLHSTLMTILNTREMALKGKERLKESKHYTIDTKRPSEWVSFDGEIKYPLYTKDSKIRNAGQGLFTSQSIKAGQVIGPSRAKFSDTGNFFNDWRKFPIAAMINHHPMPNVDIVRDGAPFGLEDSIMETCYFVANRDIDPNEELTSDYRDKNWAEYDYFSKIDLPFDEWDANAMGAQSMTLKQNIVNNPLSYASSAGLVGGPALIYASSKAAGLNSAALATCGLLWAGYALYNGTKDEY